MLIEISTMAFQEVNSKEVHKENNIQPEVIM